MKKNSIKYHVGKFTLTDKNSALSITAKVERSSDYVDALFFVEVFPFNPGSGSISIAFNAVELRSFANQLEELQHGVIPLIKKHSGGSNGGKALTLSPSSEHHVCLAEFVEREKKILFQFSYNMLYGLSKQLEHLTDVTMDAVYKTQQHVEKKKQKEKR